MSSQIEHYLRLFDQVGSWIESPEFMVLAEMCTQNPIDIEHVYSSMLTEDRINPPGLGVALSRFGHSVRDRFIERQNKERVLSGEVVLELVRIYQSTGVPPSVKSARRLAAFNQERFKSNPDTKEGTIARDVEKSFSMFRSTAHLQAVAAMNPELLGAIEGDLVSLLHFLGLAKAFEVFMDTKVVSESFTWAPRRIPRYIPMIDIPKFVPPTDHELKVAIAS